MIYLPDTDSVNYIVKSVSPAVSRYQRAIESNAEMVLCPVVHYEVVRYLGLRRATKLRRRYDVLVQEWFPIELLREDWNTAADLWMQRHRAGRPITDADLLIAVTALKTEAVLVTNNTRHFESLGLTLENWMLPEQE